MHITWVTSTPDKNLIILNTLMNCIATCTVIEIICLSFCHFKETFSNYVLTSGALCSLDLLIIEDFLLRKQTQSSTFVQMNSNFTQQKKESFLNKINDTTCPFFVVNLYNKFLGL